MFSVFIVWNPPTAECPPEEYSFETEAEKDVFVLGCETAEDRESFGEFSTLEGAERYWREGCRCPRCGYRFDTRTRGDEQNRRRNGNLRPLLFRRSDGTEPVRGSAFPGSLVARVPRVVISEFRYRGHQTRTPRTLSGVFLFPLPMEANFQENIPAAASRFRRRRNATNTGL
jgi:hypothetical protein